METTWVAHLAKCGVCREANRRYRLLCNALERIGALIVTAPDVTERVVEAWRTQRRLGVADAGSQRRVGWLGPAGIVAAAAAVLVGVWLGQLNRWPEGAPRVAIERSMSERPLSDAIAEATTATLRLALDTSRPATRVGQRLLSSAAEVARSAPSVDVPDPRGVLQDLPGQWLSRMRPLSQTARQAFGFLLSASDTAG
jgi:hypothetical protein